MIRHCEVVGVATLPDQCITMRWQAQLDSLQSQLARQGDSDEAERSAEAKAAVSLSGGMLDAIAATHREVNAMIATAHERGAGDAADFEAVTALLRVALAERSVGQCHNTRGLASTFRSTVYCECRMATLPDSIATSWFRVTHPPQHHT